jgi:endonuclease/exonuclease/phosphatase family metal-dependent hydrolase
MPEGAVRIATFNLENLGQAGPGAAALEDRILVLRPQLQRLRADILCLQEVDASLAGKKRTLAALDWVLAETDYAGFHRQAATNRAGDKLGQKHNLVTLSRFPFIETKQVWHELVPPPTHLAITARPAPGKAEPVEWERPILSAAIALPDGARLDVINLHLRAPRAAFVPGRKGKGVWKDLGGWAEGFYLASLKQAGQALEARLLVESLFDQAEEPLIAVCGDFNATDREIPVRLIRGDEEDTANPRLGSRVLVPLDRSIGADRRYSAIHHGERIMLDHILVSRPLLGRFVEAEIHNEDLGDELVSPLVVPGSGESYHAPLVAEFSCG